MCDGFGKGFFSLLGFTLQMALVIILGHVVASAALIRRLLDRLADVPKTAKGAVVQLCETLRGELQAHGVKVVTLAPGYIDTPLTRENDYPMPFLMNAADFAEQAFRAIQQGVRWRVIPWQMGVVASIMRWLPRGLFDRIVGAQQHRKKRRRSDP